MKPRIVVAGVVNIAASCLVPAFPVPLISSRRLPNGLHVQVSGSGYNVATTAASLGSEVEFATYVGTDLLGLAVAQGLRDQGLYGPGVQVCAEQPMAMVLFDEAGTRSSTSDLQDTPRLSYPAEVFAGLLGARCDLAVLCNIAFTKPLVPIAVERRVPFITDLHVVDTVDSRYNREWMAAAHVLVCSHESLPVEPLAWVEEMWKAHRTPVVIVGCGADGAVVGVREQRRVWQVAPVTPRGVRYQSGAGDTLVGSFAHHYSSSGDAVAAVRAAVLSAGWAVGAEPGSVQAPDAVVQEELVAMVGLPAVRRLR
ncbi:sugar/nucleoside kinase (ribokinase family) [Actinokineospora baliensis]|uniref:carbohydrate kinase family protein n=1 Tax=Actinokineospora baliensis TaxID=547056 RepID=UPI00195EFB94|nr:carbohydrate kinase family protein [Actinokineospora baliensis]MBM7770662.1 sugar/nucleoside kinase (ribokinase family) [Actinokineospora baliensis]